MSRSDLDKIQERLKVAIQSHQILVTKMKSDPQNQGLQKQLHDMQSQITVLSEKQKTIVQMLRKELVQKPGSASPLSSTNKPQASPVQSQGQPLAVALPQTTVIFHRTSSTVGSTKPLPLLAPKPATATNNHQVAAPIIRKVTVPEPTKTGAELPLQNRTNVNNNNKPLQSSTPNDATSSPSLRVPQFQSNRPSMFQLGQQRVLGRNPNSALIPLSARRGSQTDLASFRKFSLSKEDLTPEERKKQEFMASLDLITPDSLKELQGRRSERKRRSTANPQFSYGHFEPERKRAAASYLSQVPIEPGVKRRGRPPKNRSPLLLTNPVTMATAPPQGNTGHYGNGDPNLSTHTDPADVTIPSSISDQTKDFLPNDIHEDYCAVCMRSGELLMCDTCNLVYHLACLDPPITTIPQGLWSCPKCSVLSKQSNKQLAAGTLDLVQAYIKHKAAKEEERKTLRKKNQDLKNEKQQLQFKVNKLQDSVAQQVVKRTELGFAHGTTNQSVEQLKALIRVFQTS